MTRLSQNINNLSFYQGWYGICDSEETECASFKLIDGTGNTSVKLHSQIHAIYTIRPDSYGQLSYNGSLADGEQQSYQQIQSLECGHSYLIILKKGDGYLDVENFVASNSESTDYRMVSSCEVEDDPTPTPKQPTPTPKQPTPTPKIEEKMWIPYDVILENIEQSQLGFTEMQMNTAGDTIAISYPYFSYTDSLGNLQANVGKVKIYQIVDDKWEQKGENLIGERSNDNFGLSISLCETGDKIAVGIPRSDLDGSVENAGKVKVFEYDNRDLAWTQRGEDINGVAINEYSGRAVALGNSGTVLSIGVIENYDNGKGTGYVKVFRWTGKQWEQLGNDIRGETTADSFGYSLDCNKTGNIIAIGSPGADHNGSASGNVKLYQWYNGYWKQYFSINGDSAGDLFGRHVSLSRTGMEMAVGSGYDDNNKMDVGSVKIFRYNRLRRSYTQIGKTLYGKNENQKFGEYVSLNGYGNVVIIGSYSDANNISMYKYETDWVEIIDPFDVFKYEQTESYNYGPVAINEDGTLVAIEKHNYDTDSSSYIYTFVAEELNMLTPSPSVDSCLKNDINVTIESGEYKFGDLDYGQALKVGNGYYKMNIPEDHPILLENYDNTKVDLMGDSTKTGPHGTGFYGVVYLLVSEDFGTISYKCANHGYMGGENNLTYDENCNFGIMPTPTPLQPTPTPTPRPPTPTPTPPQPTPTPSDGIIGCTEDAKTCPDGTIVVRDPNNNCEFHPCPPFISTPTPTNDNEIGIPFSQLIQEFENSDTNYRIPKTFTAQILKVDLEGGFYGLEIPSINMGNKFIPLNIQDELKDLQGTEIEIKSSFTRSDLIGVQMWGEYLYVNEYELVSPLTPTPASTEIECCVDGSNKIVVTNGLSEQVEGISLKSHSNGKGDGELCFVGSDLQPMDGSTGDIIFSLQGVTDTEMKIKLTHTTNIENIEFSYKLASTGECYRGYMNNTDVELVKVV